MTIYLDGTNFILMTMLRFCRSYKDERSITQRYNIIMEALYGPDSEGYKITVNSAKRSIYEFSWEEVLYEMYKEEQKNSYKNTIALAKKFEHLAPSQAADRAEVLVKRYNRAKTLNRTESEWVRFMLDAKLERDARANNQKDAEYVVDELKSFFGPFWDIDFDDNEDGYEDYYREDLSEN